MKYTSINSKKEFKFIDILLKGTDEKGGLFTFKKLPKINIRKLLKISSYSEFFSYIFKRFLTNKEFYDFNIKNLSESVYKNRLKGVKDYELIRLIRVKTKFGNFYICDLSNGLTFSFKDIAISFLSKLLERTLSRKKKNRNIMVSTSGDTGSSCVNYLKNKKRIKLFVLSPIGKISRFQGKQMFTVKKEHIFNMNIFGNFDDCQILLKKLIRKNYKISTFNSVNLIRIICQSVYYFRAIYLLRRKNICTRNLIFSIPTGNFGNTYSAYISNKMGLHIKKIIAVNNDNNSCHSLISRGKVKNKKLIKTNSPSMDILIPSNLDRLLFENLSLKSFIKYKKKREINIRKISSILETYSCKKYEREKIINSFYLSIKKVMDPHTINSIAPLKKIELKKNKLVCMSTAKSFKFLNLLNINFKWRDIDKAYRKVLFKINKKRIKTFSFFKKDRNKIENFVTKNIYKK
ncbi:threonine synthase [Candidatus Vidania fulgoroideorum]